MNQLCVEKEQEGLEFSYQIVWTRDFSSLAEQLQGLHLPCKKICIVTDSTVAGFYAREVEEALKSLNLAIFTYVFPAGEASKNLSTVQKLYTFLIENHFERKDLLIALGGGVTGDLTGFTAATYLRGIDFIQVPTSLLAQVDSSVGGKTGVDFDQYKNMVGAFYQPRLVYMNMTTLLTLPEDQFASGMGEVLKTAYIRSKELYQWIQTHTEEISARSGEAMEHIVYTCCQIKASVVEEDPKEQGLRAILNFGHTLGHAVEKLADFRLPHGQCVAIGMVGAAYLSMKRGYLSEEDYDRIRDLNLVFHLPISVTGMRAEELLQATKSDKKMEQGHIKFILLKEMGDAVIDLSVGDQELLEAISVICEDAL